MAKKNIKHKEAIRRKAKATEEMAKIGLTLSDELVIIGFIFEHLAISHLTYLGLNSINKLCKTHVGVDVCVFSQHLTPPCIPVLCPVLTITDLARWYDYPLVTTSIRTTIKALSSNAPVVYHYCFDPEFINKPHYESSNIRSAFCNPRVRVIVRHESHKKLIEEEFGIDVCDSIIPDYDIEALVKLILTEMKNGRNKAPDENG